MRQDIEAMDTVDPDLEGRLRNYYQGIYDETARPQATWQNIAGQLGDQDSDKLVEARSPNRNTVGWRAASAQKPIKDASNRQRRWWNPAVAATLVMALGGIVIGLLAMGNTLGQPVSKTLFTEDFENGLGEWRLTSNITGEYRADTDTVTVHGGKASAYIEPDIPTLTNIAWLERELDAKTYLDKRIRISAYVKTENENMWAALSTDILGQKANSTTKEVVLLGLDSMEDRPIVGEVDWQRYDTVLDVPANATKISTRLNMGGNGRVWIDDVRIEVVDGNVPVTNVFRHMEPTNLGFEDGLTGWMMGSPNPYFFRVTTDTGQPYAGTASGLITNVGGTESQRGFQDLHQIFRTDNYKDQRVRFSAYIKTEGVESQGVLYMGIRNQIDSASENSGMRVNTVSGSTGWQEYEVVLDVPENSSYFYLAVGLQGKGKLWLDNAQFEVVGKDVPTTSSTPTPHK